MSPELLDPDRSGLKNGRPTKHSDCYALGMVILEVLTGEPPFPNYNGMVVMRKVIEGERPGRPQGEEEVWFTDDLWEILEQCWSPQPERRPTINAVLQCLNRGSTAWQPLSPSPGGYAQPVSDDESLFTLSYDLSIDPSMFLCHILNFTHPRTALCSGPDRFTGRRPIYIPWEPTGVGRATCEYNVRMVDTFVLHDNP